MVSKTFFRIQKKTKVNKVTPKFLEGIQVRNPDNKMVNISDYWRNQTVILKVLRRFGCPLCRYESRLLSELRFEFEELEVRLVAVGFEDIGLDDFLSGGYWDWEVLIDKDRSIHCALNLKKVSVAAGLRDLMSSATRTALSAATRAGVTGDLKGDGFQLGGTFVVEGGSGKLLYEHRQAGASSYSSLKEIYEACGGDPDDIEDKAPRECIAFKRMCDINGDCYK